MADTRARPTTDGATGLHLDGDKPRMADTIPPALLLEAGRIFAQNNAPRDGYPEGKYQDIDGKPNFQSGIATMRLLDSCMRHLLALIDGEDVDPDSGYDHAGHILCNLSMFWWMRENRRDLDNRPQSKGWRWVETDTVHPHEYTER